jgi:hypothetical protein
LALARAALQRRPHRLHELVGLLAEAVPNPHPDERADGLLPQLPVFGAQRLPAHRKT